MARALPFRSIIAAVAAWFVPQVAVALRIAVGAMIAIRHAIIANGTVIVAGVVIAIIIATGFIWSRADAVPITEKKQGSSGFAAPFPIGLACVSERVSI
ncbi:hypothetical protein AVM02_14200 [Brucella anthropi]